jgi:periplasmic protein TonB
MKLLLTSLAFLSALACTAQDTATTGKTKETTFTKVEVEAHYPGGDSAWNEFVGKNLDYPYDARVNLIQGTVVAQFIVGADGNISHVHAISGPAKGGLREEVVRVVKLSGKWVPAIQNGHKIRSYKKVPLVFRLGGE